MYIFPAIDLMEGCAVRLVRGDYAQKTVYSKDPAAVARSFAEAGAEFLHVVDLEGAKDGTTPNLETIRQIVASSGLKTEVGGGIRSEETIRTYLAAGVYRVILGTAALTEPDFLSRMVATYPEQIAVGVDIKDGKVAIKGWTEVSEMGLDPFCQTLEQLGVQTVICTDISKENTATVFLIRLATLTAIFNANDVFPIPGRAPINTRSLFPIPTNTLSNSEKPVGTPCVASLSVARRCSWS